MKIGPSNMKYSHEIIEDWIIRVIGEGLNLSQWEKDFVDSIQDQFDRSGHLSEKQIDILERIYTEKVK